jgi:hypothetical protein
MAHQQTRSWSHRDFRHRSQVPLPPVDDVEHRRMEVRSPSWLAPRQLERHDPRPPQGLIRLRPRLLTRPVMVAILVSRVWRRGPSMAEGQQMLARAGRLGVFPRRVSPQAMTTRREVLPAAVMGQLLADVCPRVQTPPPPPLPPPRWAPVRAPFPRLALVDGSTLAARRQPTPCLRPREGLVVAGHVLGLGEAFSQHPWWPLDTEDAPAQDQRDAAEILAALPGGGLLGGDLGLGSCLGLADVPEPQQDGVSRRRAKTASRVVQRLSANP